MKRSDYSLVQPPSDLEFHKWPKAECLAYAAWFHETDSERVAELTRAVQATSGFEAWLPDETPESLDTLGRWFEREVEVRPKTETELKEEQILAGEFGTDIVEPTTLTNRTFSLAMDIGRYFARVIQKAVPEAKWSLRVTGRTYADFGQPTLVGLGPPPLNPVEIVVVSAFCIAQGRTNRLRELFEIWRDSLRAPPRPKPKSRRKVPR